MIITFIIILRLKICTQKEANKKTLKNTHTHLSFESQAPTKYPIILSLFLKS